MVLEATMVVLDNSEFMRNGDYLPTRLEAQYDALGLIFRSKTSDHPENTVGVLTMAGKGPKVLTTLSSDLGKVLTNAHKVSLDGSINLIEGIQVAHLALKHRQNKNQRQRVIVFVGSPVESTEQQLAHLAKKMKKNNVAIDVINFGEYAENEQKLSTFVDLVNNADNSHFLTVQPSDNLLSDVILTSPILASEEGATVSRSNDFEFGVDPSVDPELALALRISMEEERARQEAARSKPEGEGAESSKQTELGPAPSTIPPPPDVFMDEDDDSEEAQIARAIQLSMMEQNEEQGDKDDDKMEE